jgi:uncharacterized membrane protein YfcA
VSFFHPAETVGGFELFLLIASVGAGAFGAILGLGGGVIIVPLLTLGMGLNIRYAIGASIVSVIATSSGAAAAYVKDRLTNLRVAMLLEVATTTGAVTGALLSVYFSQRLLFGIFAAMLFHSAWMMFQKRGADVAAPGDADRWAVRLRLNSSYPDAAIGREVVYGVTRVPLGFALMYGAGLMSGLLGVGSGALKVPAMDSAMRLPIKVSSATSSFMIGVTAAASAGAYYMRGDILPMVAAPVALGVLGGSCLGTRIMERMPGARIRKIFVTLLLVLGTQMALRAIRGAH